MKAITVQKAELLEKLRANREAHRSMFEKAVEGYRAKVIEELDARLADAKAGRKFDTYISLPQPEDHTGDYDRVIEMLDMDIDDTYVLTEGEFAQYVQDDWGWKQQFIATSSAYGVQ